MLGSGKFATPWARMHSEIFKSLRACESSAVAYGFVNTRAVIAKYVERDTEVVSPFIAFVFARLDAQ